MNNGKPVEFYKQISLKDVIPKKIYSDNKDLKEILNRKPRYKYIEAEPHRQEFGGRTNAQLKWCELTKEQTKSSLHLDFFQRSPKDLFVSLIMNDFYQGAPTGADCIVRKLGNSTGYRQINESLEKGMIVADDLTEVDYPDLRKTVYYPTLKMVAGFEQLQAKYSFRSILMQGRKETSVHLLHLIAYEKLRLQYMPPELSNVISFELDEEMVAEFMGDDGYLRTSRNPLVQLVQKKKEQDDAKETEEQRKQDAIGWSDSTMNHVPH